MRPRAARRNGSQAACGTVSLADEAGTADVDRWGAQANNTDLEASHDIDSKTKVTLGCAPRVRPAARARAQPHG